MAGEVDEDAGELKLKKADYMCNKTKFQRLVILLSGVTFNFILALLILFMQGLIWGSPEQKTYVGAVIENYPISEAGIEVGDRIIEVNGYKTRTWDKLIVTLNLKVENDIYNLKVLKKDGTTVNYKIVPVKEKNDEDKEVKVFGLAANPDLNNGLINSFKYAFSKFESIINSMTLIVKTLITGELSLKNLAGPIGMYSIVGETVKYGIESVLYLTAYLSINLGFINALPFPAFDGGRVLFLGIETITRKKVNPKLEGIMHTIGFVLLMILMIYISIQDVIRLFD